MEKRIALNREQSQIVRFFMRAIDELHPIAEESEITDFFHSMHGEFRCILAKYADLNGEYYVDGHPDDEVNNEMNVWFYTDDESLPKTVKVTFALN